VPQERSEPRTVGRKSGKGDGNGLESRRGQLEAGEGQVKEKWGNLTDDDLTAINGKRDQLEGKIQERYGIAKDQVKKDVDNWYETQTW
jgi:uncharacterized protein YjbJ (UPF0337 family)